MSTCGGATGHSWACMQRTYCTTKGCVRVTFANSSDGTTWYVNSWDKPLRF